MNKDQFLQALQAGLSVLPEEDIKRSIEFYSELIDDRTENGMSEEEAVSSLGNPKDIVLQILTQSEEAEAAYTAGDRVVNTRKRMSALEIVLLVLGFPIWFSLLAAAFAVVISVYVSIWAVIISLFATVIALWAMVPIIIIWLLTQSQYYASWGILHMIGAALCCLGLGTLGFFGVSFVCKHLAKASAALVRWFISKLRRKKA